jgi:hypothetical protein
MSDHSDAHRAATADVTVPPEHAQGVWANTARVTFTEHEWTLDFIRIDPYEQSTGTVVARVSCSFSAFGDLVEHLNAMQRAWINEVRAEETGNGHTA